MHSKEHFEIHTLEWLSQNFLLQEEQQVRLPWYEIIWIKLGNGTVKIDARQHEVGEMKCTVLSPAN